MVRENAKQERARQKALALFHTQRCDLAPNFGRIPRQSSAMEARQNYLRQFGVVAHHLRAASTKPKSLQTSVSKRGARAESFLVSLLVL